MEEKNKQLSSESIEESSIVEQEENLKYLAIEAQRHSPGSKEQNAGIERLIRELDESGRLPKPRNTHDLSYNSYQLVYEDAKQSLDLKLVEKVQNGEVKPETVPNWYGFMMKRKFTDAQNDYLNFHSIQVKGETKKFQTCSLDDPVINSQSGDNNESGSSHLEYIPQTPHNEVNPLPSQELLEFIKEDPNDIFSSRCMRNYPDANFRAIFLFLHDGYKWDEIARHFGIKMKAISAFYYRCCEDFKPMFTTYLQQ